ncbi:MAG: hypothetical protein HYS32_00800 [Candidatus Woesearchaeota archaeon]|nr:MAG: hypothetical protein HYS32_00800 [Candidatus Woesearchaeota archaeon]
MAQYNPIRELQAVEEGTRVRVTLREGTVGATLVEGEEGPFFDILCSPIEIGDGEEPVHSDSKVEAVFAGFERGRVVLSRGLPTHKGDLFYVSERVVEGVEVLS